LYLRTVTFLLLTRRREWKVTDWRSRWKEEEAGEGMKGEGKRKKGKEWDGKTTGVTEQSVNLYDTI